MILALVILTLLGFVAYEVIKIVSPRTAKTLKEDLSSLAPTRKSRFTHLQYYDPQTGKQIDVKYVSIPGKVPEIRYLVEDSRRRNPRLYSGEKPLHRP